MLKGGQRLPAEDIHRTRAAGLNMKAHLHGALTRLKTLPFRRAQGRTLQEMSVGLIALASRCVFRVAACPRRCAGRGGVGGATLAASSCGPAPLLLPRAPSFVACNMKGLLDLFAFFFAPAPERLWGQRERLALRFSGLRLSSGPPLPGGHQRALLKRMGARSSWIERASLRRL